MVILSFIQYKNIQFWNLQYLFVDFFPLQCFELKIKFWKHKLLILFDSMSIIFYPTINKHSSFDLYFRIIFSKMSKCFFFCYWIACNNKIINSELIISCLKALLLCDNSIKMLHMFSRMCFFKIAVILWKFWFISAKNFRLEFGCLLNIQLCIM